MHRKNITLKIKTLTHYDMHTVVDRVVQKDGKVEIFAHEIHPPPSVNKDGMTRLEVAEKTAITEELTLRGGNKRQTAIALGITINTLQAKIRKYGIEFVKQR